MYTSYFKAIFKNKTRDILILLVLFSITKSISFYIIDIISLK